jgi:hypothetical protein
MGEKKKRRHTWKSQTSLFRTVPEALAILKAADQIHDARAVVFKYKAAPSSDGKETGFYGVRIRKTTLVKGLPEKDALQLAEDLNASLDRCAATLVHRSREIHEKILLNLGSKEENAPSKKQVPATAGNSAQE